MIALFLCEYQGHTPRPWRDAGWSTICVDPAYGVSSSVGDHMFLAKPILEAIPDIMQWRGTIQFAFAMPPCTHLTNAGSASWDSKRRLDPHFQSKAVSVAEQCRTLMVALGCPWALENPRGVLGNVFGPAHYTFDPYEFGGYKGGENDDYTKRTCLWFGGGFRIPERRPIPYGADSMRYTNMGETKSRTDRRSLTPLGFAQAMFEANGGIDLNAL